MTTETESQKEAKSDAKFLRENSPKTMGSGTTPYNELELQYLLTQPGYDTIDYSELMSYYTRDIRMGNLSRIYGEDLYVKYYLSLAGDLLRMNMIRSFLAAMARVVDVLEVSQSVGGFFRRRGGTITHEKIDRKSEKGASRGLVGGKRRF